MRTYTYSEAYDSSLQYFKGDTLATQVFVDKYALKHYVTEGEDKGTFRYHEITPNAMFGRIANELARIDRKEDDKSAQIFNTVSTYYQLLRDFKYLILQGSPMAMIGNKYQIGSLSNCVVLPHIHDSYGGICRIDQQLVQLSKRRCGVGISLDGIRPKGALTRNVSYSASGVATFMNRFSNSIREVAQQGRRGALMLTYNVHGFDIEDFIDAKQDLTNVTGANISTFLTNEFLEAVTKNKDYELRYPIKNPKETKTVNAKYIWNKIIHNAWNTAEPGILFYDRCREYTPCYSYKDDGFDMVATNPCSEIPLNQDTCRLGAINLNSFVKNEFKKDAFFDFTLFKDIVEKSVRAMDLIVDLELEAMQRILDKVESDPEPDNVKEPESAVWKELMHNTENGRRIGLGITGFADMLAKLGIKYDSKEAVNFTSQLFKEKCITEYGASCELAQEKGHFPLYSYKKELSNEFINNIRDCEYKGKTLDSLLSKYGRRNIAISTCAPTGSISVLAQVSSGIEPVFSLKYTRRKKIVANDSTTKVDFIDATGDKWSEFDVYHHAYKKWQDLDKSIRIDDPYKGSLANDIKPEVAISIMSKAQQYIDHAISKTINLPKNTTEDEIAKLYKQAWKHQLKGLTVYRDTCRSGVLVHAEDSTSDNKARPEYLLCDVHSVKIKDEKWLCFVSLHNGKPFELFTGLNTSKFEDDKFKYCSIRKRKVNRNNVYDLYKSDGNTQTLLLQDITHKFRNTSYKIATRFISLTLRHGVDLDLICTQLKKVDATNMLAFSAVVSRVLKKYIKNNTVSSQDCPNCDSTGSMEYQEGCVICKNCGFSGCN